MKKKKKIKKICKSCGKEIYVLPCIDKSGGGKFCSKRCKGKWSWSGNRNPQFNSLRIGVKNPNWKGGSKAKNLLRFGREYWRQIRKVVLERDNFECQICGGDDNLAVHHIVPYRIDPKNSINTLVVLCEHCHPKVDSGKVKVPFIGVGIPTRGLVHSRTVESLLENLRKIPHVIKFSHELPIPDGHNFIVTELLNIPNITHILILEEDVWIPPGTIDEMLKVSSQPNSPEIIAVDYPVGEKGYSTVAIKNGENLWCGLGCTLIDTEVFKKMEKDWFETKRSVRIINEEKMEYVIDENTPYKYGGQDILFGIKARELGFTIYRMPNVVAGHMKVIEKGKSESNKGFHEIEVRDEIKIFQNYTS